MSSPAPSSVAPGGPNPLQLFQHQVKVVEWAKEREANPLEGVAGGVLAPVPGLGKTVCTLSLCDGLRNLVVVPKNLLDTWVDEIKRYFPELTVLVVHKEHISRAAYESLTYQQITSYNIVLTTYDVLLTVDRRHDGAEIDGVSVFENGRVVEIVCKRLLLEDREARGDNLLFRVKWRRVAFDEAHRMCNAKTKSFRVAHAIYAPCRWAITGTPILNKETDVWALLRICGLKGIRSKGWSLDRYERLGLTKLVLQMDYAEAEVQLPAAHEKTIAFQLSDQERRGYELLREQVVRAYNDMVLGGVSYMHVLALFTRLRQYCIAPYLVTPEAKRNYRAEKPVDIVAKAELDKLTEGMESWIHSRSGTAGVGSAKMRAVLEIIHAIPPGEKIIVFSAWTSALDLVRVAVREEFGAQLVGVPLAGNTDDEPGAEGYIEPFHVAMLDGDCSIEERRAAVHLFKTQDDCRLLLVNNQAGGVGLTLTAANHVIQLEPWWTPAVHQQNFARVYRMGQEKECYNYHPQASETIESTMVRAICDRKLALYQRFKEGRGAIEGGDGGGLDRELMREILDI